VSRRNSENLTYLFVAILLTSFGGILAIIGIWLQITNPELDFQGYAVYAIGAPILLCFGIPLLISGLSRKSDEGRGETKEMRSKGRKSKHKDRK